MSKRTVAPEDMDNPQPVRVLCQAQVSYVCEKVHLSVWDITGLEQPQDFKPEGWHIFKDTKGVFRFACPACFKVITDVEKANDYLGKKKKTKRGRRGRKNKGDNTVH